MKIIVENNSDLSARFCLEKASFELIEAARLFENNKTKFYHVKLQTLQNGILYSYEMWVNKIKTGYTFKFYNFQN